MKNDRQYRLAVHVTERHVDGGYHHVEIRILVWDQATNHWLNGVCTPYHDLMATSQCDVESATSPSYGWDVCFDSPLRVGLRMAEQMYKVLRPIKTRMDKMSIVEGPAATFGHYALRFARAIKAECLVEYHNKSSWYTEDTFTEYPLADLVYKVNNVVDAWHESAKTQYYQKKRALTCA